MNLSGRNDAQIAEWAFAVFPEEALQVTLERLWNDDVSRSWLQLLLRHPDKVISEDVLGRVQSASNLLELVKLYGIRAPELIKNGPRPWVIAVENLQNDLVGREFTELLAFLFCVALKNPVAGVEELFELTFEAMYYISDRGSLPYDARILLESVLPTIHWSKNWDLTKRIVEGVVQIYARGELDPKSFGRLTSNKKIFKEMSEIAQAHPLGRKLLKSM